MSINKIRKTDKLAGLLVLALVLCLTVSGAGAADVADNEVINKSGDGGYSGIEAQAVSATQVISTTGTQEHGVDASGQDSSVTLGNVDITTTGKQAHGLYTSGNDSKISITEGGTVKVSGSGSNAVYAVNGSEVDITANLYTSGQSAGGVYASDSSVSVAGNITTRGGIDGTGAAGIVAAQGSDVTLTGNIDLYSFQGTGARATSGSSVEINGDITQHSSGHSYGATASGKDSVMEVNGNISTASSSSMFTAAQAVSGGSVSVIGNIDVNGSLTKGVVASGDATAYVEGDITVTGGTSSGVHLNNDSTATIIGSITATGALAGSETVAVRVYNNSVLNVTGDITTKEHSVAAIIADNKGTANITGNIRSQDDSSDVVFATNESKVNITGQVIITGADTTALLSQSGSAITVTGDVDVNGTRATGLSALLSSSSITVEENVNVTGDGAVGVKADQTGNVEVKKDVTVSGVGASGVDAENSGEIKVGGSIAVDSTGAGAHAIKADNGTVTVGGNVTATAAEHAWGVDARNDSDVTIDGNVNVTSTTGQSAHGVTAYEGADVTIGGNVTVTGEEAHAVFASGITNTKVTVVGNVIADGNDSTGVSAMGDGAEAKVGGDVSVTGNNVWSASASRYGTVDIGGSLYVDGNTSLNAYATSSGGGGVFTGYGTVNVAKDIVVTGNDAYSALALENGTVNVSGDVKVTGDRSETAKAREGSTVTIDGSVTVAGESARAAVAMDDGSVTIGQDVTVTSTNGNNALVLYATNSSNVTVGGNVTTTGVVNVAHAQINSHITVGGDVTVSGDGASVALAKENSSVNIGGNVTVDGIRVVGSNAVTNSTVVIDGSVSVKGAGSIGASAIDNAQITIGKSVSAVGDNSTAVKANVDGTVSVGGGVSASGQNATAIYADSGLVVASGGIVSASGTDAVTMQLHNAGVIQLDNVTATADSGNALIYTDNNSFWAPKKGSGQVYATGGSTLSGDVVNNNAIAGNVLGITLDGGSSLTGAVLAGRANSRTNLTIASLSDVWNVTGDSNFGGGQLINGGTMDYTASSGFSTVKVGSLGDGITDGGTFIMKTDIVSQTSDTLYVGGATDGSYMINVGNDGSVAANGTELVQLVYTGDQNGSFSLTNGTVDMGAWSYSLRQDIANYSAGAAWELYATGLSNPGGGAVNTFVASYLLAYAETTLIQRMGDLRASPNSSGLWARAYGGQFEGKEMGGAKPFDMNFGGFHIGYDRKIKIGWDGDAYFGALFGYSNADLDLAGGGSGSVDSTMIGLYGTFIHSNGFYIDTMLKYRWRESDYDTYDSAGTHVTADSISTGGFGWSLEMGQRISFNGTPKSGWYMEPQVQLRYQHHDEGYYNLSNGLRIGTDGFTSIIGRLGALIGYETERSNIYIKAFRLKEFEGDLDIYANGASINEGFGGSWWVYGLGFTTRLPGEKNSLYIDLERTSGASAFEQKWRLNAGWRMEF